MSSKTQTGASRRTSKSPASRPAGGKVRQIKAVKVSQGRNWGPIILFTVVGLVAVGVVGFGGYLVIKQNMENSTSWQDRVHGIKDLHTWPTKKGPLTSDDRKPTDGTDVLTREHAKGKQNYPMNPPVGGNHNAVWQNCMGDVYDAPIASEHAVHSLEHGAVWITYRPDLRKDQVSTLASKVKGKDFILMSPYPNLDKPISLQAWGYQLKVDSADDKRVDEFIKALRTNASMEPGAACSGGITATGTEPRDIEGGMQKDGQNQQQGGGLPVDPNGGGNPAGGNPGG